MGSPVTVKIKFRSSSVDDFAERYAVDVSQAGIFIRTPKPLSVGTALNFEFQLQDGSPLLSGSGTVVWVRDPEADPAEAPGMGVRFDELPGQNQNVLDRVIERKAQNVDVHDQPTLAATNMTAFAKGSFGGNGHGAVSDDDATITSQSVPTRVAGATPQDDPLDEDEEPAPSVSTQEDRSGGDPVQEESAPHSDPKGNLEQIIFSENRSAVPEGATPLTHEDAADPQAGAPLQPAAAQSRGSAGVWLAIVLIAGAGAFVWWKFFGGGAAPQAPAPPDIGTPKISAPAEPSPQPTPRVTMRVGSKPEGARILVDGVDTGKVTPAELTDLDPEREIEVALDLAGRMLHRAKLKPAADTPISATLEPSTRRVRLTSAPEGATVVLNGRRVGTTPVLLKRPLSPTRLNTAAFRLNGYQPVRKKFRAAELTWIREENDEVGELAATLTRRSARPSPAAKKPEQTTETKAPAKAAPAETPPLKEKKPEAKDPVETSPAPSTRAPADHVPDVLPRAGRRPATGGATAKKRGIQSPSWSD